MIISNGCVCFGRIHTATSAPHDHDHDREQQINRPYGAVDISANLKGAVPKPATQKILLALAEKGDVTQKTYGMQCIAYKSRNPSLADDDAGQVKRRYSLRIRIH